MKVRDCMTDAAVSVGAGESAAYCARLMARYNVGCLPVQAAGKLQGIVTDRDLVVRCMAAEREASRVPVGQIMTCRVATVRPEDDVLRAVTLMEREQIRRLPVVQGEKLVGMISLADLFAEDDCSMEAADCLCEISKNIKRI
ncbi:MAG: CBS domain-containing protein [Oscillospiraceae bacterium]|nr:CBS domain-containing protein [Oscillospiraceae bacterium]